MGELIGIPRSQTIPSDLQTQLTGYVEDAIRRITRSHEWGFMRGYERIEMEAALTEGTIAVTAGGTAVVGTNTAFPTDWANEDYAELRINDEAFRVASITDANNLVLTDAALTTETAASFVLYKPSYLLSTITGIESIGPTGGARNSMEEVSIEVMRSTKARSATFSRPMQWATHSYVGGMPRIELFPVPFYNEIIHVYGLKNPTIPVNDGDTDEIPEQWSKIVDLWAQVEMFHALEDKRYVVAFGRATNETLKMMQEASAGQSGDRFQLDPNLYSTPHGQYRYGGVID